MSLYVVNYITLRGTIFPLPGVQGEVEYDRLSLNPFLCSYIGFVNCSNKASVCLVSKVSKSICSLQTMTLLKVDVGSMFL